VKTHINHIFPKTGSADRAAVRYAFDHGFVRPGGTAPDGPTG
jgi:hypothetical protein